MVRVYFDNSETTTIEAAVSATIGWFPMDPVTEAIQPAPALLCKDAEGTIVAAFYTQKIVGYEVKD